LNGDVCVAAETAQQPSKVYCFPCTVHKDDVLWADEVDQKKTVSTYDEPDDHGVYSVNSDLQSNIDESASVLGSDSDI